jgi:hypothetical protein
MKHSALIPAMITAAMWFAGCNPQTEINDLFSGTLPAFEMTGEEENGMSEPLSLFVRILGNNVEFQGELYPAEVTFSDETMVSFRTGFPLGNGLSVTAMNYNAASETLELAIGSLELSLIHI